VLICFCRTFGRVGAGSEFVKTRAIKTSSAWVLARILVVPHDDTGMRDTTFSRQFERIHVQFMNPADYGWCELPVMAWGICRRIRDLDGRTVQMPGRRHLEFNSVDN
jgi:hypothetical protein